MICYGLQSTQGRPYVRLHVFSMFPLFFFLFCLKRILCLCYLIFYMCVTADTEENRAELAHEVHIRALAWHKAFCSLAGSSGKALYPHQLIDHLPEDIRLHGVDVLAFSAEGWEHGNKKRKQQVKSHTNLQPIHRTNSTLRYTIILSKVLAALSNKEKLTKISAKHRIAVVRKKWFVQVKKEHQERYEASKLASSSSTAPSSSSPTLELSTVLSIAHPSTPALSVAQQADAAWAIIPGNMAVFVRVRAHMYFSFLGDVFVFPRSN